MILLIDKCHVLVVVFSVPRNENQAETKLLREKGVQFFRQESGKVLTLLLG